MTTPRANPIAIPIGMLSIATPIPAPTATPTAIHTAISFLAVFPFLSSVVICFLHLFGFVLPNGSFSRRAFWFREPLLPK
jgi:hypothetical protein